MKWIIGSLIAGVLLLTLTGCAGTGLHSSTSTVFGIQVDTASTGYVPSFKLGVIRNETISVDTNAFPNTQIIKATDVQESGFMHTRLHTVLAVGGTAVQQPSVSQPVPSIITTTNAP